MSMPSFLRLPGWSNAGHHPACARRALGVLAAVALSWVGVPAAQAANAITLTHTFAGNINFVTTGNTLRSGANGVSPCTLLSGNSGTSVDAGTSNATVSGIPAGSTIVAAYLYYSGSGATSDYNVTFNGNAVSAGTQYQDSSNDTGNPFFGAFVDVTSFVTGNASYSFGGLSVDTTATYCGNSTVLAAWGLVVIYSNTTTESFRVINVYDGFQPFHNSSITLTPNNFDVPGTGINAKFAVLTWEGDPDISGSETLQFNGNVLSDTCNANGNQYNSTINTLSCTGTAATDDVFYGIDFDTFNVSADVSAGQTSATTFYQTGNDLVFLTAEVISIADVPVSDLAITKTHSGTINYGANATWTLAVKNNGPDANAGTTTVTDTLAAGLTYVSATGTGWACGAAGQVVTCTTSAVVASGASFPNITLVASVGVTTASPLANTASVAISGSGATFDNVSGNNSSTDSVTLTKPDLSTSTKNVVNTGGGDAVVGSTLQYTITLTESAGAPAYNVSVTDNIPANVNTFTVTGTPSGSTNSSTGAGTGTNNDGFLNITGITVPANGSVTIVFTVSIAAGTANCTNIDNSATVTNPYGNGATPSAPTITVAQSSCASSGNKILYVYDNTGPTYTNLLNRVVQTVNTGTGITVNNGTNHVWNMNPTVATGKSLVLPAGNVSVTLIETASGVNLGTNRPTTVTLLNNGVAVATSASQNVANGPTAHTYTIAIPATTMAAGTALGIQFNNNSGTANRNILISQKTAGQGNSTVTFSTSTVINVDSVTAYNAIYPATTTQTVFVPGQTVYICAVISDPFGSADAASANITLTDPNGTVQVSAAAMTAKGATDCAGTASNAKEAYEYTYAVPSNAKTGFWTAQVTGNEGTEGTITNTANGSFDLDVPSLLIMKTVAVTTDPVEGVTKSKAIPGATVQYTVLVQNNGRGPVDSGTLVISDPVPANTALSLPAKPPFTFTDGATSSGLSVTSGSDTNIVYSNNGGTTYAYVPSCTRPCTDAAITNFKITFAGSMNGKTGASAPSFAITYNVIIQ